MPCALTFTTVGTLITKYMVSCETTGNSVVSAILSLKVDSILQLV